LHVVRADGHARHRGPQDRAPLELLGHGMKRLIEREKTSA
jgi:hypothetical protein